MKWYFSNKRNGSGKNKPRDEIEMMSQEIEIYLRAIATETSGENLNMIGRTLVRLFGAYLTDIEKDRLGHVLKRLRRAANQTNPPTKKAADALKLGDIYHMLKSPEYLRLSCWERESVDILLIAFVTLSRVAEIITLTVRDVAESGQYISVRAKTYAATCQRHVKKVSDALGLYPTRILRKQRAQAILNGRTLLYSGEPGRDVPVTSSDVTNALRRVTNKMNMICRITAHSGRKGAAVAAVLAEVPLVVVQSLGLWRCIDSLQAYLGEALRQEFCVLDLLCNNTYNEQHQRDKNDNSNGHCNINVEKKMSNAYRDDGGQRCDNY